jgi:hypothetical protein
MPLPHAAVGTRNPDRELKLPFVTAALSGAEDGVQKVRHIVARKGLFDNPARRAKAL